MSHRLANRRTGKVITDDAGRALQTQEADEAAMFYVKELPWHGLGKKVDTCLTASEAIVAAGLDYEVASGPIYTPDMKEIEHYSRTYRVDYPERTFGIVGDKYTIVQNKDGFEIVDAILGNDKAKFDTAGALDDGRTCWMSAVLPNPLKIAGDEILKYLVFKNSHDGRGRLILCVTPIRVVCMNTLTMAIGNPKRKNDSRFQGIKHTVNYEERIKEAAKLMGFVTDYYDKFRKQAEQLLKIKVSEKQFFVMMDQLFGKPSELESKRAATLSEKAREQVFKALNADDLDNVRGTGWGAYNAIADYSDHMRGLRGDNKDENRFTRTFEDNSIKDAALDLILATK